MNSSEFGHRIAKALATTEKIEGTSTAWTRLVQLPPSATLLKTLFFLLFSFDTVQRPVGAL
jgi:hypothetical protein